MLIIIWQNVALLLPSVSYSWVIIGCVAASFPFLFGGCRPCLAQVVRRSLSLEAVDVLSSQFGAP